MTDYEHKLKRLGFLEGVIEGITLYATWKNGVQKVGCLETDLKTVLRPYKEEHERLTAERERNGNK